MSPAAIIFMVWFGTVAFIAALYTIGKTVLTQWVEQ